MAAVMALSLWVSCFVRRINPSSIKNSVFVCVYVYRCINIMCTSDDDECCMYVVMMLGDNNCLVLFGMVTN